MQGAAVALVIALHVALIALVMQARRQAWDRPDADVNYLVWLPLAPEQKPLPPPLPPATIKPVERDPVAVTESLPRSIDSSVAETPSEATPSVDWKGEVALSVGVAVNAIQPGAGFRAFGPRPAEPAIETGPKGIFETPENRKGTVGADAAGDPVVWLNKNCYQELEKPVQTARDWTRGFNGPSPIPTCVWSLGKLEPRGDLFDHIRKRREATLPPPHPDAK